MNKQKAKTILAEIRQHIKAGISGNISFSAHTIHWMAENLVAAIDEVEKVRREKKAAVEAISAEKEQAVINMERVKEEYFKLLQDIRKAETKALARRSKGRLRNKWRNGQI